MNVLYVSLSYVPSRRASSVHVMKMCAALHRAGHEVRLLAKRSDEPAAVDDATDPAKSMRSRATPEAAAHAFYGTTGFAIEMLPRPKPRGGGIVFAAATLAQLVARRRATDLVYSRDLIGALAALELRMPTIAELHGIPDSPRLRAAIRRIVGHRALRGLVVISEALRRDLEALALLPRHAPVIVAHDAADPPGPIGVARPKPGRPRLGYVGNLYPGRGVDLVIELARLLPACDVEIVGGSERDLAHWRAQPLPENLQLAGFVRPADLAAHYASFDVLLMPYPRSGVGVASGKSDTSRWCSPMKMFEYMAAGAPIISSDLPVLGEVLRHDHNALIAPAGDAPAWAAAVTRLLEDPELAARLAQTAYDDLVRDHTWDARVQTILGALA